MKKDEVENIFGGQLTIFSFCRSLTVHTTSSIMPYKKITNELRNVIIDNLIAGRVDRFQAAEMFQVPYTSICRIYKKYNLTGVREKLDRGGKKPKMKELERS